MHEGNSRTAFGVMGIVFAIGCAALGGCQSVANPFVYMKPDYSELPADAMQALALEIETAVQQGVRDPQIAGRDGLVLNEQVRQAIHTRAARGELLNEFRAAGYGIELSKGLIEIGRDKEYRQKTSSKERDRNAILIMSENEDRWTIYEGIIDASKLPARSLSAVQQIFFDARLQVLPSGQLYTDERGEVVAK